MNSTLYIVSTPIGNMQDITFRAMDIFKSVDYIISEDTRETQKLLNFFQISKPQISYRDENHYKVFPKIIDLLSNGCSLALVTDRGTPLISDPGFKLVKEVLKNGYSVDSIPGPSAVVTALTLSGLPTDRFIFLGFAPKSEKHRKDLFEKYGNLESTLIFFESPNRITRFLEEAKSSLGNRNVCVAKELTKVNQEVYRFNLSELDSQKFDLRGEFVVLISKEGV